MRCKSLAAAATDGPRPGDGRTDDGCIPRPASERPFDQKAPHPCMLNPTGFRSGNLGGGYEAETIAGKSAEVTFGVA